MTGGTTLVGAEAFARTMDEANDDLANPEAAQEAVGRLLVQRGASYAPKVTGTLAGSLVASTEGATVSVGGTAAYTAVTEYGGGNNIPSQPFLRPALENSTSLVLAAYTADAQRALNKVRGA